MASKAAQARKKKSAKKFKAERRALREKKGAHPGRDEAYKAFIRTLGCFVCEVLSERQQGQSEAAHLGEERGLGQKADDRTCGPLCKLHHTKGTMSHHRLGKLFFSWLGLDREKIIQKYNRLYKKQCQEKK